MTRLLDTAAVVALFVERSDQSRPIDTAALTAHICHSVKRSHAPRNIAAAAACNGWLSAHGTDRRVTLTESAVIDADDVTLGEYAARLAQEATR